MKNRVPLAIVDQQGRLPRNEQPEMIGNVNQKANIMQAPQIVLTKAL